MRNIFAIIIVMFFIGCRQQSYTLERYIQNPPKSDTTCISDINRAKNMVENGKIIFCYPTGFGSFALRQEKYLMQLCEQYNLTFKYELFSCIELSGQRTGCFGAYMDKVISDKFGSNFKQYLLSQADNMMIAANDTIPYYLCDKSPKMIGVSNDYESTFLIVSVPEELHKQLKVDKDGKFPFMDIGFYIDKEGNTSGYFLNDFVDRGDELNQKFKDELFDFGVEQLKQIKGWETGIVNGQKVNTKNNVRVFF